MRLSLIAITFYNPPNVNTSKSTIGVL